MEEYAPKIVYIKGIHNTVANAIPQLEYNLLQNLANEYTHATLGASTGEPSTNPIQWKTFSNHWQCYNESKLSPNTECIQMNTVFANCSEDDDIYPLATADVADAQKADTALKHLS